MVLYSRERPHESQPVLLSLRPLSQGTLPSASGCTNSCSGSALRERKQNKNYHVQDEGMAPPQVSEKQFVVCEAWELPSQQELRSNSEKQLICYMTLNIPQ